MLYSFLNKYVDYKLLKEIKNQYMHKQLSLSWESSTWNYNNNKNDYSQNNNASYYVPNPSVPLVVISVVSSLVMLITYFQPPRVLGDWNIIIKLLIGKFHGIHVKFKNNTSVSLY